MSRNKPRTNTRPIMDGNLRCGLQRDGGNISLIDMVLLMSTIGLHLKGKLKYFAASTIGEENVLQLFMLEGSSMFMALKTYIHA